RKLDRKGKAGEEATVAATTYRGMNALHAAVGGQGKLAACRYLVETVRMDVNMWDSSPSKARRRPWSTPWTATTCPPSGTSSTMAPTSPRKRTTATLFFITLQGEGGVK
uniref:Uncharacterized protein n=1 Tax=Aegilops tauschii subsp. strangulata TaxID=200361 RepID=A0A453JGX7_AEGTS